MYGVRVLEGVVLQGEVLVEWFDCGWSVVLLRRVVGSLTSIKGLEDDEEKNDNGIIDNVSERV